MSSYQNESTQSNPLNLWEYAPERRKHLALELSDKVVELKVVTNGIASRHTPATLPSFSESALRTSKDKESLTSWNPGKQEDAIPVTHIQL